VSTILITGSEGLIGKPLGEALKAQGFKVRGIDIVAPEGSDDFGDILDYPALADAAKDCDGIVHLAAISRVVWGQERPELCWNTNVIGTTNVVQAARQGAKR